MNIHPRDLQARLAALGHPPGPIDGIMGRRTQTAASAAIEARGVRSGHELFHPSGLHRVHWHWTAGAAGVIELERDAYHFIIDQAGNVVPGTFPPEANADPVVGKYAPHTLNANTGAIGVAIDAMAGAREVPFDWGEEPMTWQQVEAMCKLTAKLCREYDIPVSRYSTLSHAEVQPTLGIPQRRKWDIMVLPGMTKAGDPVEIGDRLRAMTLKHLQPAVSTDGEMRSEGTPRPVATVRFRGEEKRALRLLDEIEERTKAMRTIINEAS